MSKNQNVVLLLFFVVLFTGAAVVYQEIRLEGREYISLDESEDEVVVERSLDPENDTIKIGINASLTGVSNHSSEHLIRGVELAIEELNREGGALGKPFEYIVFDNRSTQIGSKQAMERAVEEGVVGVIGPDRTSFALPAADILQSAKIPMISHLATHPDVTKKGNYIFRTCYTDDFQSGQLASYIKDEREYDRIVILRMIDEEYSIGLSEQLRERYESLGGSVVWKGNYKSNDFDYSSLIDHLKELEVDAIFIAGYSRDTGFIVRQARNQGIEVPFLGADGIGTEIYDFGGNYIDGFESSTHWHEDLEYHLTARLQEAYTLKYSELIIDSEEVPLAYDATLILGEAIRRANSLSGLEIRDEIFATEDFEGSAGVYSFDKNGDVKSQNLAIVSIRNRRRHLVKEIKVD